MAENQAHKLKVLGSNPSPATNLRLRRLSPQRQRLEDFFLTRMDAKGTMNQGNLVASVLLALSEALRQAAQGVASPPPAAPPTPTSRAESPHTIRQALDAFLSSKHARGCKPRYLVALRCTLGQLAKVAPGPSAGRPILRRTAAI